MWAQVEIYSAQTESHPKSGHRGAVARRAPVRSRLGPHPLPRCDFRMLARPSQRASPIPALMFRVTSDRHPAGGGPHGPGSVNGPESQQLQVCCCLASTPALSRPSRTRNPLGVWTSTGSLRPRRRGGGLIQPTYVSSPSRTELHKRVPSSVSSILVRSR